MRIHTLLFLMTRLFLEQTADARTSGQEVSWDTHTETSTSVSTATSTTIDPGSYDVVIGFKVSGYADCVEKVSKADAIPPVVAPWKAAHEGADLSPQAYCQQLYPNVHPICDPGPNTILCTNGNQPHWDSNNCRWTCQFADGSCSNGRGIMETMIDCVQGYHRVDDAATCSAQCLPDVCPSVAIDCQPGYHPSQTNDSCRQTCVPDKVPSTCPVQDPPSIQCSAGSQLQRDPYTCGWSCVEVSQLQ